MKYAQIVIGPAGSGKVTKPFFYLGYYVVIKQMHVSNVRYVCRIDWAFFCYQFQSTYCYALQRHTENTHRMVKIINLDPAAEDFKYKVDADIRDLIHVDDAMEDEEMHLGPNGGLIFCMEFLMQNISWLEEHVEDELDDTYYIFDCPGQIELYTHLPVMKQLVDKLQSWDFKMCAIFLLDSHFMVDPATFISGTMAALSAMTTLEIPFISVLSKIDLLSRESKRQLER